MNNDQRPQLEDFICQYCDYVSHHFSEFINHLKYVHAHNPDFIVNCGIDECRKSYKMVPKLVNHIRRSTMLRIEENNDNVEDAYLLLIATIQLPINLFKL